MNQKNKDSIKYLKEVFWNIVKILLIVNIYNFIFHLSMIMTNKNSAISNMITLIFISSIVVTLKYLVNRFFSDTSYISSKITYSGKKIMRFSNEDVDNSTSFDLNCEFVIKVYKPYFFKLIKWLNCKILISDPCNLIKFTKPDCSYDTSFSVLENRQAIFNLDNIDENNLRKINSPFKFNIELVSQVNENCNSCTQTYVVSRLVIFINKMKFDITKISEIFNIAKIELNDLTVKKR